MENAVGRLGSSDTGDGRDSRDPSTREDILDAALAAFSTQGFEGSSTRAIAARAGVNQGLIPYYFGTKQALWREAVDRAFAQLRETMRPPDEEPLDVEAIARLVRRYVAFVAAHPEFVMLMNEEGKRAGSRMRWIADRHVRPVIEGMVGLFEGAGIGGSMPPGIDPMHRIYIFLGAAATIFHQAPECRRVAGYDPTTDEAIEAHGDALVQLFLGDASLGR